MRRKTPKDSLGGPALLASPGGYPLGNPIIQRGSTWSRVYCHDVTREIPFFSREIFTDESLVPAGSGHLLDFSRPL